MSKAQAACFERSPTRRPVSTPIMECIPPLFSRAGCGTSVRNLFISFPQPASCQECLHSWRRSARVSATIASARITIPQSANRSRSFRPAGASEVPPVVMPAASRGPSWCDGLPDQGMTRLVPTPTQADILSGRKAAIYPSWVMPRHFFSFYPFRWCRRACRRQAGAAVALSAPVFVFPAAARADVRNLL